MTGNWVTCLSRQHTLLGLLPRCLHCHALRSRRGGPKEGLEAWVPWGHGRCVVPPARPPGLPGRLPGLWTPPGGGSRACTEGAAARSIHGPRLVQGREAHRPNDTQQRRRELLLLSQLKAAPACQPPRERGACHRGTEASQGKPPGSTTIGSKPPLQGASPSLEV